MKKRLAVIIIMVLMLSAAGCKKQTEIDPNAAGDVIYRIESVDDLIRASDAMLLVEYLGYTGDSVQGDVDLPETHTKIQMGSYYAENDYKVIDVIAGIWEEEDDIFTGLQYIGVYDYRTKTFEEENDVKKGDYLLVSIGYDRDNDLIYLRPFEGSKHIVNKKTMRIHWSKKLEGYKQYKKVSDLKEAYGKK